MDLPGVFELVETNYSFSLLERLSRACLRFVISKGHRTKLNPPLSVPRRRCELHKRSTNWYISLEPGTPRRDLFGQSSILFVYLEHRLLSAQTRLHALLPEHFGRNHFLDNFRRARSSPNILRWFSLIFYFDVRKEKSHKRRDSGTTWSVSKNLCHKWHRRTFVPCPSLLSSFLSNSTSVRVVTKVVCIGAGPCSLWFQFKLRKLDPRDSKNLSGE